MDNAKQQLIEKLKSANNVLVTVSHNPSVDQLAALLGLGLVVNKQGKHCAAVFSGDIPSTIDFLKPEETFEKNTDSLRDFIIALDRNKADKLRYKVEGDIVRIFITPYRTSISQDDLDFSQGDLNVDLLIAIGVKEQNDLDNAITAHGRILHDATVATINLEGKSGVGSINWAVPGASSLSELVADLAKSIGEKTIDSQIATALLTGIVAETDRFRNEKTSAKTMNISATLMNSGANQQLIASQLEEVTDPSKEPAPINIKKAVDNKPKDDGTLEIEHNEPQSLPPPAPEPEKEKTEDKEIEDNLDNLLPKTQEPAPIDATLPPKPTTSELSPGPKLMTQPPTLGSALTANSVPDKLEPSIDTLNMTEPDIPQIYTKKDKTVPKLQSSDQSAPQTDPSPVSQAAPVTSAYSPPPPNWKPPIDIQAPSPDASVPQLQIDDEGTLSQIEQAVNSPHVKGESDQSEADAARQAIDQAISSSPDQSLPPIEALNAQPLGTELHSDADDDPNKTSPAPPVPPPILPR